MATTGNAVLDSIQSQQGTKVAGGDRIAMTPVLEQDKAKQLVDEILKSSAQDGAKMSRIDQDIQSTLDMIGANQAVVVATDRTVQRAQDVAALKQQQTMSDIAAGIDLDGLLARKNKELVAQIAEADAKQKEFLDKRNTTIGEDGFLSWLGANLTMSSTAAEYNAARAAVQTTRDQITDINTALTQSNSALKQTEQTMTQAVIDDLEEKALAEGEVKILTNRLQAFQSNYKGIVDVFTMRREAIDTAGSLDTAVRLNNLAFTEWNRDLLKQQTDENILRMVNIARRDSGLSDYDVTQIRSGREIDGQWAKISALFNTGMHLYERAIIGDEPMGLDAYDSYEQQRAVDATSLNKPTVANAFRARVHRLAKQRASEEKYDFDKAPVELQAPLFNELAKKEAEADAKVIDRKDNIYVMPNFSVMAKTAAVKEMAAYNKVWKEMGLESVSVDDLPQVMFDRLASAVDAGTLKSTEAIQDFVDFFKHVKNVNNSVNQYGAHHIPKQDSYKYRLSTRSPDTRASYGIFETEAFPTDLTDVGSVAKRFSQYIRQIRVNKLQSIAPEPDTGYKKAP